jgi:hypothetical protein
MAIAPHILTIQDYKENDAMNESKKTADKIIYGNIYTVDKTGRVPPYPICAQTEVIKIRRE